MRKKVLGVTIDDVSQGEALEKIAGWLTSNQKSVTSKLVFTPGPEFLVTAQSDPEFKKILNTSDLNVPDGVGLQIFGGIKNIVHGVDLMRDLCELASKNNWSVGLLGGREGVSKMAVNVLKKKHPKLKVSFTIDGAKADQYLIDSSITIPYDTDILFVAFGHPKQEKFLEMLRQAQHDKSCHSDEGRNLFRVGMGVGGSFEFIGGNIAEPPEIFSKLGLKWFGRFLTRPVYMLPKIYKAVILYPWLSLCQILKRTGG